MSKCAICGSRFYQKIDLELAGSASSDNRYINHPIVHHYCMECGYIFIDAEVRLNLTSFYRDAYRFLTDSEEIEPVSSQDDNDMKYSNHLVSLFSDYLNNENNKTFFDIGAGKGNFIDAIHNRFPDIKIYALEPSKAYNMLRNKTFVVKHYNTFFDVNDFSGIQFDYVSLIGVLEHILDPWVFLNDVRKIMKDNAYLFIEVPNFKKNKSDLLTVDHISKFTDESITNLFNVTGFNIAKKNISNSVPMQFVVQKAPQKEKMMIDSAPIVSNAVGYLIKAIQSASEISFSDIALYGQGLIADYLVGAGILKLSNIRCVIDDNYLYQGKKWKDSVNIVSFEKFEDRYKITNIFLAMNDCYHQKVLQKLTGYTVFGAIL